MMDWKELNHGLFTALLIQQIGMSWVLALIILVAAFTVIATLIMVVLEKKKEIALLKALGAKDGAILRMFLYQGGIIGVSAPAWALLGYGGCKGARLRLPARPEGLFHLQAPGGNPAAGVPHHGRLRDPDLPRRHNLPVLVRGAFETYRRAARGMSLSAWNGLRAGAGAVQDGAAGATSAQQTY